jgi:RNA polymerase sigma-70 factor (ECF subfamily)
VLLPSATPARTHRRLPHHAVAVRHLIERGVPIDPLSEESPEDCEARLETALMAAFRDSGRQDGFEALYEYARGPLLAWIVSLAGRRREVDPAEVLQDTFVNVYRYAQSFRDDGPRSFRVWSRTIAGNLIRRTRAPRGRCSLQAMPEGLQEPGDGRAGPPEELALGEEGSNLARAWLLLLARYAAAYERLAPRDRRALEMVELEDLPYSEACRRLGVGLSNLKMILFRARRRMRAAMAQDLEPRRRQAALRRAL